MMTTSLHACDGCGRHVKSTDANCPFCERPGKLASLAKAAALAATVAMGISLSACYGGPPPRPRDPSEPAQKSDPQTAPTTTGTGSPLEPVK